MAAPAVANIVHSGATVYVAPVATAVPDETTVAYDGTWTSWIRVGYTAAPLTMAYEDERVDLVVEEVLSPVRQKRIGETCVLETVLAELTADYLAMAVGGEGLALGTIVTDTAAGAAQKPYSAFTLGGRVDVPEMALGIEGRFIDASGNAQPIRIFAYKATAQLGGELEFSRKKDDVVGIPVKFTVLADASQAAGAQLLTFHFVTGPVSA